MSSELIGLFLTVVGIVLTIVFSLRKINPSPPPIPQEEIETLRAQGFVYAAKIRDLPMAASAYAAELKPLAEKLWADPRYGKQAPKESALIFRLYAATLLLARPSNGNMIGQARSALPWLSKSIKLEEMSEPKSKDFQEVRSAQKFFTSVAAGKVPQVELKIMLKHLLRVAMPEASEAEVKKKVEEAEEWIRELMKAKEDFEYLQAYRVPTGYTIGQLMRVYQLNLKGEFPQKNVGGDPLFVPMPNGNTKVMYVFKVNGTLSVEWEVNKARKLVRPLNEAAESVIRTSGQP